VTAEVIVQQQEEVQVHPNHRLNDQLENYYYLTMEENYLKNPMEMEKKHMRMTCPLLFLFL